VAIRWTGDADMQQQRFTPAATRPRLLDASGAIA
jgi:hypothetical protein